MKYTIILHLLIFSLACTSQQKSNTAVRDTIIRDSSKSQIAEYVTDVYEDSKSNIWLGTIQKGIALYDQNQLKYFTKKDGLPTNRVIGVLEDKDGNYWMKSGEGLVKYDGNHFVTYHIRENDFASNMISHLLIDSKGTFWVGTWGGVFHFDRESFTYFPIPTPDVSTHINGDTINWISDIKEDQDGNIWIARDNFGVCKYDRKSFTHYLKKDGLHSNNVMDIEIDKNGHIWFGTRKGQDHVSDPTKISKTPSGVNKLVKNKIVSIREIEAFNTGEVYEIYRDHSDNIWISTMKNGVYKFDGQTYKNYPIPISIMSITQDSQGNIWLGGAGGLYRITADEDQIVNVTTTGPWK